MNLWFVLLVCFVCLWGVFYLFYWLLNRKRWLGQQREIDEWNDVCRLYGDVNADFLALGGSAGANGVFKHKNRKGKEDNDGHKHNEDFKSRTTTISKSKSQASPASTPSPS